MKNNAQLVHYWNLANLVKSDEAKAAFFEQNEEAFNLDIQQGDDFENCKLSFCAEKGLDDEDTDEFQSNSWESFPKEFKIYAFDYCIKNGIAYESIEASLSVNEITSLISLESLNEKIEDLGITVSEAEDDVMLILERRVKKTGGTASEDDLYDATKQLLVDLRDWLDDNHPDNIQAA